MRISPTWQKRILERINLNLEIEETIDYNPAAQWLIIQLTKVYRPFKILNLGAGVKIITTKTDICPCCKKKLE